MKHVMPGELDTVAELLNAVKIAPMPAAERQASAQAVMTLARALDRAPADVSVTALEFALTRPDLDDELGGDARIVRAGVARALRAFADPARRALARRLRGNVPTLADACAAARLMLSTDDATRAVRALERLAAAEGVTPADLPAATSALEPALRRATPETFGSRSPKALKNNVTLVRRALRLVGAPSHRATALRAESLPMDWAEALDRVVARLPLHAKSARAVLRRLILAAADEGFCPASIGADFAIRFYSQELARKASNYVEKMRQAVAAWNENAEAEGRAVLPRPGRERIRVEAMNWGRLPAGIRADFDALLAASGSASETADKVDDWATLVPDEDDLGLSQMMPRTGAATLAAGTTRNWRDYIKRAYQASIALQAVCPCRLADLLTPPVLQQIVRMTRLKRRERLEAQGRRFDPAEKPRREHSVLEGLLSIARRRGVDESSLAELKRLADSINPKIVGTRRLADGTTKNVYAKRQIGPMHALKLAAFNDLGAMKRWFETPTTLWERAIAPLKRGEPIRQEHVALARSALVAQICQRVAPLRRENLIRLRCCGDERHLVLPLGDGEGRLHIPGVEVKNDLEITVGIDAETVSMLKFYIAHFLPVARRTADAAPGNPHLFPGAQVEKEDGTAYPAGFGYMTESKLNTVFRKHVMKFCAIDLNLHVMRHLAGKVILDIDPSAMLLVKEILAHKHVSTTEAYYAEVSQIIAQNRYWEILDAAIHRTVKGLRFRVGPGAHLFRGGRSALGAAPAPSHATRNVARRRA